MHLKNWLLVVLLASSASFVGCGKSKGPPPAPVAFNAHVDLAKLQDALGSNTNPEVQQSMAKIASGLRYGYDYNQVLAELQKLAQNPSLTEPQKKVVNDNIEQVKQILSQNQPQQPK